MKTIKAVGLCAVLGIACLREPAPLTADDKGARPGNEAMAGLYDISFDYPWVRQGKVFSKGVGFPDGRIYGITVYMDRDGNYFFVQSQMESINVMFSNEVMKEGAVAFLMDKRMARFIESMFSYSGKGSSLLTERSIRNWDANEKNILQKYNLDLDNLVIIKDNDWIININVKIENGAIEKWTVSGTVDPLAVGAFSKTLVAPGGTLKKIVYVGDKSGAGAGRN
jgi:hypothetical protein